MEEILIFPWCFHMGIFFNHGGIPKWMVYVMENPNLEMDEWMMTGGTPISGNLHMALMGQTKAWHPDGTPKFHW